MNLHVLAKWDLFIKDLRHFNQNSLCTQLKTAVLVAFELHAPNWTFNGLKQPQWGKISKNSFENCNLLRILNDICVTAKKLIRRFKGTSHLATFWKMSFWHPLGFWKIWYQRNQSQKLETSTKLQIWIFAVYGKNPAQRVLGLHRTDKTDYRF